jgi:predicted ABC-type ATPase
LARTKRKPILVVIGGPNGSGKTTFYLENLCEAFPVFVNADLIAQRMAPTPERDRLAAQEAETERERLLIRKRTFAMETVLSRTEYWLDFVDRARRHGFEILLIFLCLESPELNILRVASRVGRGGHPVKPEKVHKRWQSSIHTAILSIPMVDELWLFDNTVSNRRHRLIGQFRKGASVFRTTRMPDWARPFFA